MGYYTKKPVRQQGVGNQKSRVGIFSDDTSLKAPSRLHEIPVREGFRAVGNTTCTLGVRLYGYRHYNPELGRWINRDPIGERGGRNLFAFTVNRALSLWDILGLETGNDSKKRCPCDGPLKAILDSEPFKTALADLKERKCLSDDPKCGQCRYPHAGAEHVTKSPPYPGAPSEGGRITICTDGKDNRRHSHITLDEILRHEFDHANRLCGIPYCQKIGYKELSLNCCVASLWDEMRAWFCGSEEHRNKSWDELAETAYNSIAHKKCAKHFFTKDRILKNTKKAFPHLPKKENCFVPVPETPPNLGVSVP